MIKNAVKSNFMLKVLSLFIAIFLWVYVLNLKNPVSTRSIKVAVELINKDSLDAKGLKYSGQDVPYITARVKAKRLTLNQIDGSDIGVRADLAEIRNSGEQRIRLELYKSPSDIESLKLKTNTIRINIVRGK